MRKILAATLATSVVTAVPLLSTHLAGAAPSYHQVPNSTLAFDPTLHGGTVRSAFLPNGQLLVTDPQDGTVVEMNPDGTNQRIFASGLSYPDGIAVYSSPGGSSFVYIAQEGNLVAGALTQGGVSVYSTTGAPESSDFATPFNHPQDIAVNASGDVFVSDYLAGVAKVLEVPGGTFSQTESIGGTLPSDASTGALAIDPATSNLYVADEQDNSILLIPAQGGYTSNRTFEYGAWSYLVNSLAVSGGSLIAGELNYQYFWPQLTSIPLNGGSTPTVLTQAGEGEYTSINPVNAAVATTDGLTQGDLFVGADVFTQDPGTGSNTYAAALLHMSATGTNQVTVTTAAAANAHRFDALGSTYNQADPSLSLLYTEDDATGSITSITPSGNDAKVVLTGFTGLNRASAIATDAEGNLWVLTYSGKLLQFGPNGGAFSTGTVIDTSSLDGVPTGFTISGSSLFVDASNGTYVATLTPVVGHLSTVGTFSIFGFDSGAAGALIVAGPNLYVDAGSTIDVYDLATAAPSNNTPTTISLPTNANPVALAVDGAGRIFASDPSMGLLEVDATGVGAQVLDTSQDLGGITSVGGTIYASDNLALVQITVPAAPSVTSSSLSGAIPKGTSGTFTLTGTNLAGATAVDYLQGGNVVQQLVPISSSSTSVTASYPTTLSKGTYDIEVTTDGGTSALNTAVTITISDPIPQVPVVTSLTTSTSSSLGGGFTIIGGYNFTGATAVHFGTVAATSITVLSGQQISATIPPGVVGTVDVTVTGPGGTSAKVPADHFTYTAPPVVPLVAQVSPSFGPAIGGTSLTITGANFTGVSFVSVGASAYVPTTFTSLSSTKIVLKTHSFGGATGPQPVEVHLSNGKISTMTNATVFTTETTPTVTAVSPSAYVHGTTKTLQVTGASFLGATAVHLVPSTGSAVALTGLHVTSFSSLAITVPATVKKGSYTLEVTTPSGTSAKVASAKVTLS